jgi:hypothetical protein
LSSPPVEAFLTNVSEIDVLAPTNQPQLCANFYSNPAFVVYYNPVTFIPLTDGGNPKGYVYENQVPYPTSVTVGSKGTFFTTLNYNKGPNPVSKGIVTWEVTADTPTTLLFTTINTATTMTDQLLFKSITTYRINSNNTLTDLRKNIQATNLVTGDGDQNIYETYQ